MGRRKKAVKKVVKKKRPVVAKIFKCLFCNNDKSVICQLDTKSMTGQLECGICHARYQTTINKLTEPIDVFTEWLDAATEAQEKAARRYSSELSKQRPVMTQEMEALDEIDLDDDAGFIDED